MTRKDFTVVFFIVAIGVLFAYVINQSLSYGNLIKTTLPNDSWLDFWGGYSGGLFAAIVGYLAIVYSNRNSEKAIKQQYKLLQEQDKRRNLDEYVNCLKKNLDVINLVEISKYIGGVDYNNLPTSIETLYGKKASIHAQDIQFNYIQCIEDKTKQTNLEKQYIECWNQAKICYFHLLDVLVEYVQRTKRNQLEIQLKLNNEQKLQTMEQLLAKNPTLRVQYENEILQCKKEISDLTISLDTYNHAIEQYNKLITSHTDELTSFVARLFNMSVSLIKEKENMNR